MCDQCWILRKLATLDPCDFVSFAKNRVHKRKVLLLLPELGTVQSIGPDLIENLNLDMGVHNRTVLRGIKMGLVKKCDLSSLLYSSVSDFAVQMQCSKLTQIICAFCTFGERIAPLVSLHPNAIFWNICCPLVITRDRWLELSMQMLHMAAAADCLPQYAASLGLSSRSL